MTTPGTTLIEELEQAASSAALDAVQARRGGDLSTAGVADAFAARLRQRAAWVREQGSLYEFCSDDSRWMRWKPPCGACFACVIRALTGPDIPSTAAPETRTNGGKP